VGLFLGEHMLGLLGPPLSIKSHSMHGIRTLASNHSVVSTPCLLCLERL
jgi:hypothetical protein